MQVFALCCGFYKVGNFFLLQTGDQDIYLILKFRWYMNKMKEPQMDMVQAGADFVRRQSTSNMNHSMMMNRYMSRSS
jgi:hypothetical protein